MIHRNLPYRFLRGQPLNPPLLHIFSQGTLQEFSTTIYHQELTEVKPLAKGCVGGWIEEGSKGWNGRTDGWMNG